MTNKTITCVVMFADVAGSTEMYENMGDDPARERIAKALNALISIASRHKGKLVKTIGDEILVYFLDADMAVMAARTMQEAMEDVRTPETVGVSIRIGMQIGSVLLESNDIFGDTVNTAARVASLAKARQILCTQEIAYVLKNVELANNMRPFDRLRVKGRKEHLNVFMYAWEEEDDLTNMATASSFTNPARQTQIEKLALTLNGQKFDVPTTATSYMLGRGKGCELRVEGDLISRHHTKIEYRRGKYILTDQSTNGTFVQTDEGQEIFLRREEWTLYSSGYISMGRKVESGDIKLIHFACS